MSVDPLEQLSAAANHFSLFSLPVRYALEQRELEKRYLELTRLTHPDFAGPGEPEQLRALELSARINEAYATLSDDLRRAGYMLDLLGGADEEPSPPAELLERIFSLREQASEAQHDPTLLGEVKRQVKTWQQQLLAELASCLAVSKPDVVHARQLLATARYLQRILAVAKVPNEITCR